MMQADSQMSKDRQVFYDASLQYVFKIQEVQERKKFEFVEPVSARIQLAMWLYLNTELFQTRKVVCLLFCSF